MGVRTPAIVIALFFVAGTGGWLRPGSAVAHSHPAASYFTPPSLGGVQRSGPDDDEFLLAFETILEAAPGGFADLRGGSGSKADDSIVYPSSVRLPGASETSVWIPSKEGRPYVRSELYSGEDMTAAEKMYDMLVAKLKPVLAKWEGRELPRQSPASSRMYFFKNAGQELEVIIERISYPRTGSVEVVLTVTGPTRKSSRNVR